MRRLLALPATLVSVVLAGTLLGRHRRRTPPTRRQRAAGRRRRGRRSRPACRCVHQGRPVHRRTSSSPTPATGCTSGTPRTAPAAARPPTPTAATTRSVPLGTPVPFVEGHVGGHPGHHRRSRDAGLQLLDRHAPARPQRRPGLRLQRLRAGARRVRVGPARQPVGAVLGRPDRARHGLARGRAAGSTPTATPGCAAAPSRWPPRPAPRSAESGGGLDVRCLHRHPRHPRRLGLGLPGRAGARVRRAVTVAMAPLPGSNGLGDLYREVRYAQKHSGIAGLRLVAGTKKFAPVL